MMYRGLKRDGMTKYDYLIYSSEAKYYEESISALKFDRNLVLNS